MAIPDLAFDGLKVKDFGRINILVGKNGCGKSSLLRGIQRHTQDKHTKYITPERGGAVKYNASYEQQLHENRAHHLISERSRNQKIDFRGQSAALFNELAVNFMQALHYDDALRLDLTYKFETRILDKINALLDNITIELSDAAKRFLIRNKRTQAEIDPANISSGESELFSLAVEIFSFAYEKSIGADKIVFFDEPDVHLHPDLQYRFAKLINTISLEHHIEFVIATHSTVIISALSDETNAKIGFMHEGKEEIKFREITNALRDVVPVFSPHPLSNQFNSSPILIVEGDDDAIAWTQATKSSQGHIRVSPCVAGTIGKMSEYEQLADELALSLYDIPKGYSIRDRDSGNGRNTNLTVINSLVLNCYSLENLLLSDDVLAASGTNWPAMKQQIEDWLNCHQQHLYANSIRQFCSDGYLRQTHKIKDYRNILLGMINPNRPFYMLIGQAIGGLRRTDLARIDQDGSLPKFLGEPIMKQMLFPSVSIAPADGPSGQARG